MIHVKTYRGQSTPHPRCSPLHSNRYGRYFLRGILTLITLWCLNPAHAQASGLEHKIGPMLKIALSAEARAERAGKKTADRRPLAVILKGDTANLARRVNEVGGSVGTVVGDILTAQIPRHALPALMA